MSRDSIKAVAALLRGFDNYAIAVSGGVDSLTLATIAGRHAGPFTAFHAVSPAVPSEATERVERMAIQEGWTLSIIDAAEFDRSEYVSNPVNRCFFCKQSLYSTIAAAFVGQVFSGTNRDDLQEYRPGLVAAREKRVRHPFAELGISKATIRDMARTLGLGALSELPASPCLSSRVESGITITAPLLASIHRAEVAVRKLTGAKVVRCRFRREAIVIELDDSELAGLEDADRQIILRIVQETFTPSRLPVRFAAYRVGSAFLLPETQS